MVIVNWKGKQCLECPTWILVFKVLIWLCEFLYSQDKEVRGISHRTETYSWGVCGPPPWPWRWLWLWWLRGVETTAAANLGALNRCYHYRSVNNQNTITNVLIYQTIHNLCLEHHDLKPMTVIHNVVNFCSFTESFKSNKYFLNTVVVFNFFKTSLIFIN